MSWRWANSLLICLSLTLCAFDGAQGAPSHGVSVAAIKKIVQESDILSAEYHQQVYSSFANGVASISLFRHPQSTRDDCKIEGVLLARKIIALDPAAVHLVRCVFYDYDRQNEFWDVEVRAQLVKAYAEGKIGQQELINSVVLTEDRQNNPLSEKFAARSYKSILDEDSVCVGAHAEKRLATALRLKELKQQGVDVTPFREQVLRIEDAARRGHDQNLVEQINAVNQSIDGQVQQLIGSGQLRKPETRRSKNSLGSQKEPALD